MVVPAIVRANALRGNRNQEKRRALACLARMIRFIIFSQAKGKLIISVMTTNPIEIREAGKYWIRSIRCLVLREHFVKQRSEKKLKVLRGGTLKERRLKRDW